MNVMSGQQQAGQQGGYTHPHAQGCWQMPQDHPGMMMPNTGVQQPRIIGALNPLTIEAGPNSNILAIGNPGLLKKAAGQEAVPIASPNKYQLLARDEEEEDIPVFASIDNYYESIDRTLKEERKAAKKER